ncbi:HNH endonuclease [Xanthobacter sp. TB0139]|uniref:HNH endonuclease n=1 Tax=Xanthobacter sp. TB0139 TaxID=3459178 RepID=UPI00403A45FE
MTIELTPEDVRAARALVQWSQDDLAKAAGVGVSTVADFEKGARKPISNNLDAIRHALEHAHVVFMPTGPAIYNAIALYLMTEGDGAAMVFRYQQEHSAAIQEIVATFGTIDGERVEIAMGQLVTPEMRIALDELVKRYGAAVPQLNKLKQKIGRVPDGKYFLLLPGEPSSSKDRLELENYLHALNHPETPPTKGPSDDLFDRLLVLYDLKNPRTDRKTTISTGNLPRTCRFCHRTANETSFKKVAHVIPTALGNDHLKSAEECDECNEYFGQHTEPSLIGMLDVQRVFLGTQGRGGNNGRPKLKFGKDTLQHDGQKVVIQAHTVTEPDDNALEVTLGPGAPLVPMSIYRSLVKIVLSVLDKEHLPNLMKTIEWVRYGLHVDQPLPKVEMATVYLPPNPSAQITVYTRRAPHPRLPHVIGEFRLGCHVFVFAVPFSTQDQWNLLGFFEETDFKKTFRHYQAVAKWNEWDLSGTKPIALSPRLKFLKR